MMGRISYESLPEVVYRIRADAPEVPEPSIAEALRELRHSLPLSHCNHHLIAYLTLWSSRRK